MARTKGVGFNNVRSFVTDSYGAQGWDQALADFERPDREVLESVLAMGWYDLGLYARLIRAVDGRFGAGDLKLVSAIGRYEAEKDLTTIHQWVLRLVRPSLAIEQMSKYWRRFHDTGDWAAERRGEREISARLSGWGLVDAALCRELVGYLQRTLELLGARDVMMEHTRCRVRGEPDCEFRALYRLRKDREEPVTSQRHGIDRSISLEVLQGHPSSAPPVAEEASCSEGAATGPKPRASDGPASRPGGMRSSTPPPSRSSTPPPSRSSTPPPSRSSTPPPSRSSTPPPSRSSTPPPSDRWSSPPSSSAPSTRSRPRS